VGIVARHVGEALLHELADARRAVDGRDDGHVVARAHPAVRAPVSVEGAHGLGRVVRDRPDVDPDLVGVRQRPEGRLWLCTWSPGSMAAAAKPITWP